MENVNHKIQENWYFIGERITIARESAGYTQKKFSEIIGISANAQSSLESGKSRPSFETLIKIINTTHCDPSWLLLGEVPASAAGATGKVAGGSIRMEALNKIRVLLDFMPDGDVAVAVELIEALGRRRGK